MRTLLVLRHGKSSWSDPSLSDHDRPLKRRGKRAANKIGEAMRERDLVPDLVISSTARRARATAKRAAEAAGYEGEILQTRELYMTGVGRQLEAVAGRAGPDHRRVMIVGHNPMFEDLVETLTGEDVTLTTANLARVDLAIRGWAELPDAKGQLRFVLRPRELE